MWLHIQFIKSKRFLEGEGRQGGGGPSWPNSNSDPEINPQKPHSIKLCMYVSVYSE